MKPLVVFPEEPVIVLTPHGVSRAEWWSGDRRYFLTRLDRLARYGAYRVIRDAAGRTIVVGLYEGRSFVAAKRAVRDAERRERAEGQRHKGAEAQRGRGTKGQRRETLCASVPLCLCALAPLPTPRRVERVAR